MENQGTIKSYFRKLLHRGGQQALYPLSNSQRGMWIYQTQNPSSSAYNLSYVLHLQFALDLEALREALRLVVDQNPILQTAFINQEGVPKQHLVKRPLLNLELIDLSSQAINFTNWKGLKSLELAAIPFDLSTDSLFRFELYKLDRDDHALFFVVHHLIFDGWSAGVFLRDLERAYEAIRRKESTGSLRKAHVFSSYCIENNNLFESGGMDDNFVYWFNRLFPAPKLLNLPYDFRRTQTQARAGRFLRRFIDEKFLNAINACAHDHRCTPFVFFLSAFFVTLWKITGSNRIMAGVSIANRSKDEFKDAMGPFSEVLPILGEVAGDHTFSDFLLKIKEHVAQDFAHCGLMLDRLVQLVHPKGMPLGTDFFQVGFDYQNFPWPKSIGGVDFIEEGSSAAKIELNVSVSCVKEGMQLYFEYDADLFNESTIASIADAYLRVLEDACVNSSNSLHELHWLPRSQEKIIQSYSRGPDIPSENLLKSIHEVALAQPKHLAVAMGDNYLSYEELWKLSSQMAHALCALGVQERDVVSFKLEACEKNAALILAIWRLGAAYHPINSNAPVLTLERHVNKAHPRVLIVNGDRELDAKLLNTRVILFHELIKQAEEFDFDERQSALRVDARGPAYLIFTSGSSGEPKGVMINHELLSAYAHGAKYDFNLKPEDRVLQFAPLSFDASLEEILPALLSGSTLVIKTDSMMGSTKHFLKAIASQNINIINIPSSYWHALIDDWPNVETKVRMIITGGEPVSPYKLSAWLRMPQAQKTRVINSYGVTEATVVSSRCDLSQFTPEQCDRWLQVPVGNPFPNCELLVVDQMLRPVPIGIFGEIIIISGVPDNYFNNANKTNGYCDFRDRRAFRTGDRGRFRHDGMLECKGRDDQQVKLDGFRVDLHEIELALMQLGTLREACVVISQDEDGSQRLIAHIEAISGDFSRENSRRELRKYLAPYQIPHHFVEHELLPKSPNLKIDRLQLVASLDQSLVNESKARKTMPRAVLERIVTSIWQSVIPSNNVGLHDDFFAEGGSSLLAIRMLSLIENSLGVSIPLPFIFDDPTLMGLVEEVQRILSNFGDKEISSGGHDKENTYKMHPHERERFQVKNHVTAVFCPSGSFDRHVFFQALAQIVNNIQCLHTIYDLRTGIATLIPAPQRSFEVFEVFESCADSQLDSRIDSFINKPFDITRDFSFRAGIFQSDEGKTHIALVFLEAAIDIKSIDAILEELCNMYALAMSGNLERNLKLSRSKTCSRLQQRDYSAWLHKYFPASNNAASYEQELVGEQHSLVFDKTSTVRLEQLAISWLTSVEVIFLNLWLHSLARCEDSSILAVQALLCQRPASKMLGFRGAAGSNRQILLTYEKEDLFFKDALWAFQRTISGDHADSAEIPGKQRAHFNFCDFFPKGLALYEGCYLEPVHFRAPKETKPIAMSIDWRGERRSLIINGSEELFLRIKNALAVLHTPGLENIKLSEIFFEPSQKDEQIYVERGAELR